VLNIFDHSSIRFHNAFMEPLRPHYQRVRQVLKEWDEVNKIGYGTSTIPELTYQRV
jgi:hypothetical protein